MEVKVIKEGGRNYGVIQRSGLVTFATVVLKRGMTTTRDLYKWFELVAMGHMRIAFRQQSRCLMSPVRVSFPGSSRERSGEIQKNSRSKRKEYRDRRGGTPSCS